MSKCERCSKVFPTKWHLARHQNNKTPCEVKEEATNIPKFNCLYCAKDFKLNRLKTKHENTCKDRNDIVRKKEIHCGVQLNTYYDKCCRFCDKTFSSRWYMHKHLNSCIERSKYLD